MNGHVKWKTFEPSQCFGTTVQVAQLASKTTGLIADSTLRRKQAQEERQKAKSIVFHFSSSLSVLKRPTYVVQQTQLFLQFEKFREFVGYTVHACICQL